MVPFVWRAGAFVFDAFICLLVLLIVLLFRSNKMSKSVAIQTEVNCGFSLPPAIKFFSAGMYGKYSHMT